MKTLVLGATTNPSRYAYLAINKLRSYGHEVKAVGRSAGQVADVKIEHDFSASDLIDTITMYLSAQNQKEYYDKIIAAKPRRIIFNPGAENGELSKLAAQHGIVTENACTLVLLNTDQY